MTRFHFERPDGSPNGNAQNILVHLNEIVPPQGYDTIGVTIFDTMEYASSSDIMSYEPDDWFNTLWQQRIQLTINAGQVPSTQTDFSLLINDTYTDLIGETGSDIRFTDGNNIQLDYEIQSFDDGSGELIAWVKKPSVSDGDVINIYFNNLTAVDEQNPKAVWSDYTSTLHMEPSLIDSTGKHIVTNEETSNITGKIGQARSFDGSISYLDLGDFNLFGNTFTLSAWIKPDTLANRVNIITKSDSNVHTNPFYKWLLFLNLNGRVFARKDSTTVITNNNLVSTSQFQKLDVVYDGVNLNLYVNGVLQDTDPVTSDIEQSTRNVRIGARDTDTPEDFFDGIIDEVRILNISRDQDWLTTEFNNQTDQSTFYTTSPVESVPTTFDNMGYDV